VNCGNCFMNMIMEASSIIDKDGKTGIPDSSRMLSLYGS
jgi:hypothetical protein